ncbi:MAG: four helix bundle protein [Ferruginibacter sp.]|nr:four helix bundle protein [Cytophagales bacterium]
MQSYQDLKVWHKAHAMVLDIYAATQVFPKEELYGLTSQIRRSAVSTPANLAEGCGKNTKSDIANFFQIALGSLHETEYYLLLARDLSYIREERFVHLNERTKEVKAMLIALIKTVRTSS